MLEKRVIFYRTCVQLEAKKIFFLFFHNSPSLNYKKNFLRNGALFFFFFILLQQHMFPFLYSIRGDLTEVLEYNENVC